MNVDPERRTDPGKRLVTLNHWLSERQAADCNRRSSPSSITLMRHLLKGKRKESLEPPRQSDPCGRPAGIAVGSPALQAEPHVILDGTHNLPCRDLGVDQPDLTIPPDEGGGVDPRITFQDGIDADQELPASKASTPGFAILDAGYGNRPISKSSWSLQMDSIDSTLPTS